MTHTQARDCHAADGIPTWNSSIRVAAEPRLRSRGHRDRLPPTWFSLIRLWESVCVSANLDLATGTLLLSSSHPIKTFTTNFNIPFHNISLMGRDSSVGIATRYGLYGLGIESRRGRDLPPQSRPVLGPTQPPIQWIPGLFPGGKAAGTWRWPLTPSSAEVKERVKLYRFPPLGLHGLF